LRASRLPLTTHELYYTIIGIAAQNSTEQLLDLSRKFRWYGVLLWWTFVICTNLRATTSNGRVCPPMLMYCVKKVSYNVILHSDILPAL
ncbi:MAG TPA: hypothetical protein VH593_26420, partial [Ktedonobacteraceae bacterium]